MIIKIDINDERRVAIYRYGRLVYEDEDDLNFKIIKAVAKSGYSGAIVMMELERAGLKIVEK